MKTSRPQMKRFTFGTKGYLHSKGHSKSQNKHRDKLIIKGLQHRRGWIDGTTRESGLRPPMAGWSHPRRNFTGRQQCLSAACSLSSGPRRGAEVSILYPRATLWIPAWSLLKKKNPQIVKRDSTYGASHFTFGVQLRRAVGLLLHLY